MNISIKTFMKWLRPDMTSLLIRGVFAIFLFFSQTLYACLPHEIYVRSHEVKAYQRSDGTKVKEYLRSGHCRELLRTNYFQDSTTQRFKSFSPKLKKWNEAEKALIIKQITLLPPWLAKYTIKEMLRADSDGTKNPASSIPFTKTILIYDAFFKSNDLKHVIIHEMAHLAIWDLETSQVEEFARVSGWEIKTAKDYSIQRRPPQKVLLPDSVESISEDFANNVEVYYSSPERLRAHNPQSLQFIDKLIKLKEKP